MFGQRLRALDLALPTWARAQPGVLRTLASLQHHVIECTRLCLATSGNIQVVAALGVGIFIGLAVAPFLTEEGIIALSLVTPLCALAMLQLPRQNRPERQREPTQPEQAVPPLDEPLRQNRSAAPAYLADEETMAQLVEDALRHLYDSSYLGQHQLAELYIIQHRQWPPNDVPYTHTHLALGHALHALLIEIIEQLRPAGQLPSGAVVPPRQWHPYLILHAHYVRGELTREIMARLFVGEGTYNRTRRRAIHSVTRALCEVEQQTRTHTVC